MMKQEIYLAGGCFWGLEEYLANLEGVLQTEVGYANGRTQNPTYEQVCRENTGHAEAVRVVYDPQRIRLAFLLERYFEVIDPCAVNRQGGDTGTQYRTGIYYTDQASKQTAREALNALAARTGRRVAVELLPLENYCRAEEYHQKYLQKNPGGYCHIPSAQFEQARAARDPAMRYARRTDEELRAALSAAQYEVVRQNATEPPFRNAYFDQRRAGIYVDVTTGEPLFASADQFDSGCGWPSFSRPIPGASIEQRSDSSHGMLRTEVRSGLGDAHLGHVFDDGPQELGGLRYCINSAALRFIPKEEMEREGYGHLLALAQEPV